MLKVALTGGIATGKTAVLGFFSGLKIPMLDSDAIVSGLYKKPETKKFLKKNFATLEKKEIARIVFSDSKKRLLLEKFFHPLVFEEISSKLEKLEKSGKKIAIVEIPLLFETGIEKKFDRIIVVKATQPQQLYRLQKKGYSAQEAFARILVQIPGIQKLKKADFVIDNTCSLQCTKKQVRELKKILLKKAKCA